MKNTYSIHLGTLVLSLLFLVTASLSVRAQLPDEFAKVDLLTNLENATTFKFLPDGRIVILERFGEILIYKPDVQTSVSAGTLPVFHQLEDGLVGIAVDPDFENNNKIYLCYSAIDFVGNRVSRFSLVGDQVDFSSEEILLQWETSRTAAYHTGGDMDFDSQGNLYIATGDNSGYPSGGYTAISETNPDFSAEKSSSNTNDLRGKILRIRPGQGATYTIPAGNLFQNPSQGLPEIYVMGARNPYRIHIDEQNNDWLFYAEVGPDAASSSSRGPLGLDEINLVKEPGNYGWPYFSGTDNEPYLIDYTNPEYYNDPAAPENISQWNTGNRILPPAQPAWFDKPSECYLVGFRYNYDPDLPDDQRLPQEFDDKLIYYDFNSSKIWAITTDAQGGFVSEEQLAPSVFPSSKEGYIDMEIGPDGKMYVMAYGAGCCPDNVGTGKLVRVDYTGITSNSPPNVVVETNVTNGPVPLTVNFTGDGTTDPNDDSPLFYSWNFDVDNNSDTDATTANATNTYTTPGTYRAQLSVEDGQGGVASRTVTIYAGNTLSEFSFDSPPDGALFDWNDDIEVDVKVTDDQEDNIPCADVNVIPSVGHVNHFHDDATITGCPQTLTISDKNHNIDGDDDIYFVLGANYTDSGGLTSRDQILLHPKRKEAEHFDTQSGTETIPNSAQFGGGNSALQVNNNGYISLTGRNLVNMNAVKYLVASENAGGSIEMRTGSPTGTLVATTAIPDTGSNDDWVEVQTTFTDPGGKNDLFFVFKGSSSEDIFRLNYIEFLGGGVSTDNSPPEVNSVKLDGNNEVTVFFSEYVDVNTAQTTSNYLVDNGIEVLSAEMQSDNRTVVLTTSPMSTGVEYNVSISNVQNTANLPIISETFSISVFEEIRINAGGGQVTLNGSTFSADEYSQGGQTFTNTVPIEGTANDELYQTERFADATNNADGTGAFGYNIPVGSAGEYDIRLHFAEIFFDLVGNGGQDGGPGSRVFDVVIEGQQVLSDFDILAEVDAATVLVKEFDDIEVNDGFVSIIFNGVENGPKISGIEILSPDTFSDMASSEADIIITSPENGWEVKQPFEVAFRVENWVVNEGDTHLHYFVDGVLVNRYYFYEPIPIEGLSLGEHTIRIELFTASHMPTGIFDEVTVNIVDGNTCNETPFPDSWTVHQLEENSYTSVYTFADYDLDGDAQKDIVTGGWWYKNPGSASGDWVKSTIGEGFGNVVHVYDFDADGDLDLLGTALGQAPDEEYESAQLVWAQNNGAGIFTVYNNIPAGDTNYSEPFLAGLAGGDFNNNGTYQMAINWNGAEQTNSPVQMLTPPTKENITSETWSLVDISNDSKGEDLQAGDIDRDGDIDLFQGENWLRNNGNNNFETFDTGITYSSTPDRAQLADFDRNGTLDAVVGQLGLGGGSGQFEFAWFSAPVDPTQPWERNVLDTGIQGSLSVFATDLDFDGDQDIVVGEWLGEKRLIAFNNDLCGSGEFTLEVLDDGGLDLEHHDGARVTDIDNDGDLDVISNGWRNDRIPRIYENTSELIEDDDVPPVVVPDNVTRINAGGPTFNFGGNQWAADQGFNGGSTFVNAVPIANTDNDQLYQTERFRSGGTGSLVYEVPVTNGEYSVNLHFAEIFYGLPGGGEGGGAGSRVFNIDIEGQGQRENYDIFQEAGGAATAIVETFEGINVTDQSITITLTPVTEFPKISGIEIVQPTAQGVPTVDAGADQMITLPTNSVVLVGSGSDLDGGQVTYLWTQQSGPEAVLSGEQTTELTVSNMAPGAYVFRLTVTDDEGESAFDQVSVTVLPENGILAVAEAAPTTGEAPLEVTFTGSASMGDIETYLWDFKDGNTSTDADTVHMFVAEGSYEVTLTVTDAGGATNTASISITVGETGSGELMGVLLDSNPPQNGIAVIRVMNQPENFMMLGINVHDMSGRLLNSYDPEDIVIAGTGTYEVPVHILKAGVYFFKIAMNQGEPVTLKVLIRN